MPNNFTLKPKADDSGFLLHREGDSDKEFTTFRSALEYARMTHGAERTHLILYDKRGCPSMSFPTSLVASSSFPSK